MRIGFLLSKEHILLGIAEVLALTKKKQKDAIIDENFIIVELNLSSEDDIISVGKKLAKRLSHTQSIYELLFSTEDLKKDMESYNWNEIYQKNFSVRIKSLSKKKERAIEEERVTDEEKLIAEERVIREEQVTEKELAAFIWRKVTHPLVDLKNAATQIECICARKIYVCKKVIDVPKTFLERRPHLRPSLHPSSLHPKLARLLVNLTGASSGDTIVDPFCGTGGILIEAGLMRIKTKGYDISDTMLSSCKKNLEHYKIKNFKLEKQDATTLTESYNYIVTDIPYGKSTKVTTTVQKTALAFFQNMEEHLRKRGVLVVPDIIMHNKEFAEYVSLQKKLEVIQTFTVYVHKSLTRHILILEPR